MPKWFPFEPFFGVSPKKRFNWLPNGSHLAPKGSQLEPNWLPKAPNLLPNGSAPQKDCTDNAIGIATIKNELGSTCRLMQKRQFGTKSTNARSLNSMAAETPPMLFLVKSAQVEVYFVRLNRGQDGTTQQNLPFAGRASSLDVV